MTQARVFISYSHRDEKWKDLLVRHLGALPTVDQIGLWVDTGIRPGADWLREIEQAMDEASVAVLLVSADFLGSEFIAGTELPALLRARADRDLRVIPLMIRPCPWSKVPWLVGLEHRPKGRALSEGSEAEIDRDLAALAAEIADLLDDGGGAAGFEELVAKARALLASNREAAKALAGLDPGWKRVFDLGGGAGLAAELTRRSGINQVLIAVHRAHRSLAGQPEAARVLEQLLALIVPVLYRQRLAWSLPGSPGGLLMQVPVATATVAEMVMAGQDGRGYRYRPLRSRKSFPEGVGSVAGFPEPGIDFGGDRAFQDFVDHLAAELVAEEDRQGVQRGGGTDDRRYQTLAKLVDGELRWRAEDGEGLRRYFLYDSRFAQDHAAVLERLRKALPSLCLLELTGGDLVAERELCRPLRDLLYHAQTQGKTGP